MIVALDANCLVAWASRGASSQLDRARLDYLLSQVAAAGGKVIIPAPAFAEFLVGIDEAAAEWINVLDRKRSILIAPFDRRAAFECSLLDKAAIGMGDKRGGRKEPWQHIKVDRQIVAIARVNQAGTMIANDAGLRATAMAAGLRSMRVSELELPDSARQQSLLVDGEEGQAAQAKSASKRDRKK